MLGESQSILVSGEMPARGGGTDVRAGEGGSTRKRAYAGRSPRTSAVQPQVRLLKAQPRAWLRRQGLRPGSRPLAGSIRDCRLPSLL